MKYDLIKQLIGYTEAFERDNPAENQQTLPRFTAWLDQQVNPTPTPIGDTTDPDNHGLLDEADSPDTVIGVVIAYLYRYTKLYSKKALADSALTTIDEFSYMVILLEGGNPTKTELIERNIHEKTTGTEILRRLINGGLIEQVDDEVDRRSKRLKLTEKGMAVMYAIMPRMGQLVTLVSGNLTLAEKTQLAFLLNKLHLFHNELFLNERDTPVEELMKRLPESK